MVSVNCPMDTNPTTSLGRQRTINGFAVVGFIALVTAGVWLAIYSTRFVPTVVNRIGSAAVYLGSVFTPASKSSLSVVPTPTASTTIPFGDATTTSTDTTSTTQTSPATKSVGEKTSDTYQIAGTPAVSPSGLADLAVSIDAIGYLTTDSTDSFFASSSVPYGNRPAIRFTVKNIGTNWSGTWSFSASIPTFPAYTFHSPVQQSLAPGDSIDYTLGFDRAITGPNQTISVTIDAGAADSNTNNNSVSASVTVLGS